MSSEPQQVKEAREAIANLLGRLQPTPTSEWIEERTSQIMLQFGNRAPDDPHTKRPV
jgi:hypothetical protein